MARLLSITKPPPEPVAGADGRAACACEHEATASAAQAAATMPLDTPYPVPDYPPSSWLLERPDWLQPGQGLTITEDGQVGGYFYEAGACITSMPGVCPQPSPTRYAAFHQGNEGVVTADGSIVPTGVIGNVGGHASPFVDAWAAVEHYANPDRQIVVARAYDDEHGGYIAGALVPGTTYGDVALLRRSALSGDWRYFPPDDTWWARNRVSRAAAAAAEWFDCVGPTLVNTPGLPLVRQYAAAVGVHVTPASRLGGLGGIQIADQGAPMKLTLTDGTVIELDPGETLPESLQGSVAAPPPPPGGGDQQQKPPNADREDSGAPSREEFSNLQDRVAALEEVLAELTGGMVAAVQSQAAALAAPALPEPAAATV